MQFLGFSAFTSPAIRNSKMKGAADVYFLQSLGVPSTTNSELSFEAEVSCIQDAGKCSLVSCSCRLVIHAGAACRGWERAEEILPAVSRYVWSSSAQLGPGLPADTARPASPPSRGAAPAPYLRQEWTPSVPAGEPGTSSRLPGAGPVSPCSAARLCLRQSVGAPHVSSARVGNTLSHGETLFLDAE